MATTTPNYGWDVPTSTDYVKDGATAIETLGDDIDATLWTALGGAYPGLRLIKKQTIGSGVASVNVTGAFSSTYQNYRIIVNGGTVTGAGPLHLQLGATTSGYRFSFIYNQTSAATPLGLAGENAAYFSDFGRGATTNGFAANCDLYNPNLATATGIRYATFDPASSGGYNINGQGVMPNSTQYTDFTVISGAGNMTGGTIYVYGYGAS